VAVLQIVQHKILGDWNYYHII